MKQQSKSQSQSVTESMSTSVTMSSVGMSNQPSSTSNTSASIASTTTTSPNATASLFETHIFAPGDIVEVQTIHQETITGEVLAFEYNAKLLILKSPPANGSPSANNITCVNLGLCSKVNIISGPKSSQTLAELDKLPDIDIKKVEDRMKKAIEERKYVVDLYKSGVAFEGIALFTKLQKTIGENPGISWDRDSIMIGKSIRISVPYRADCITIVGKGSTSKDETSVQYTKQLLEKYWRDLNKDPYTLESLPQVTSSASSTPTPASSSASSSSAQQQTLKSTGSPKSKSNSQSGVSSSLSSSSSTQKNVTQTNRGHHAANDHKSVGSSSAASSIVSSTSDLSISSDQTKKTGDASPPQLPPSTTVARG